VGDCEAKVLFADGPRGEVAVGAARRSDTEVMVVAIGVRWSEPGPTMRCGRRGRRRPRGPCARYQHAVHLGDTGRPKGVAAADDVRDLGREHRGYVEDGDDRHLCTGPLYHAAPLAFSLAVPLHYGVGIVLMERWDAVDALRLIEDHGITHTPYGPDHVPPAPVDPEEFRRRYDLSSLRYVLHAPPPVRW